jgi:rhodanese-related sulfurtransferase
MNTKFIIAALAVIVLGFGVWVVLQSNNNVPNEQRLTNVQAGHHAEEETGYELYPGVVADKIAFDEDVILLDVRTREEYEEVHLKNALLLPVQELSQQSLSAIGLGEDMKDKEIILYCRSGSRSKTGYDIMTSLGYTNIKSVSGGMIHWEEDNYPLTETGAYSASEVSSDEDTTTPAVGPLVAVDRALHDFGVIPQFGGTVEARFTVTNPGTQTLEVGQITTSCSCTSATISNSAIEPGEAAVLTVVFDPDFHAEPLDVFKRTIFIPTNDPNTPEAEVSVQVDIAEGE